jgi:hypothetical protein
MKILYHNYANQLSTEPVYMHNAFARCGIESVLWGGRQSSAYDVFDNHKPDVFVTHFQTFTYDIMSYLKNNNGRCDVVMNVTGATQAQITSIEQTFKESNIKSPFIFTNEFDSKVQSKLNLVKIYPAADIFLMDCGPFKDVGVPEAIISNNFDQKVENYIANKSVFHLLYVTGGDLDSHFDIRVTAQSLCQLYKIYPKVVLIGDNDLCCSQIFLDMNMAAKKVEAKSSNPEGFEKMLKEMFVDSQSDDIQSEIRSQIKAKHTPFDRAWRFMKYLKNDDGMNKVMKVKNELPEILRDV